MDPTGWSTLMLMSRLKVGESNADVVSRADSGEPMMGGIVVKLLLDSISRQPPR